ncbi:MAG: pyruvate kinase [Myxococcaceae bacterium]|nr:pyruvate kinase [Myxococcaceae bacterium]
MPPDSMDLSRVMLKRRRTKIVATVGPASNSPEMLARLVGLGVDVFRLNFSHGTHELHGQAFSLIREAAAQANRHVAVLADLCGPKIRAGTFEGGSIPLERDEEVVISTRPGVVGRKGLIPSEYTALASDVKVGDRVLLDDGNLELSVLSTDGADVRCRVVHGGTLKNKKGINLPGVAVSAPALTEKDRADALFAAGLGVDFLALSFVRSADDVRGLKALLAQHGHATPVVSKIEKPEALGCIGDIIEASDAIMVARGDLGVELPPEEVPLIQQELVRLSRRHHRPVIVATQMLESMIDSPRPTRAEVTDVASAAFGHTDAVMLSAETASGAYPAEAVAMMDRVLRMVEGYSWKHGYFGKVAPLADAEAVRVSSGVSRAVSMLSGDLEVRAVVVPTHSGATARVVSAERPAAPVLALSAKEASCRRLSLSWGVTPVLMSAEALRHPASTARAHVLEQGLGARGEHVLLVWDSDPQHQGAEPTVSVLTL